VYLLRDVERFLNHKNISPARFGRDALGDPRFVFDLRRGREPRDRTVRRVKAYLEQAK
jgi:2,4-dienoyl-CoA reductase-like NADH-dependent reductase (Old Yellow Enzyme family)